MATAAQAAQPLARAILAAVYDRPQDPQDAGQLTGGAFGAACSFRYRLA